MARVRVSVNQSEIRRLAAPGGVVHQKFERIGQRLADTMKREITALGAVDSGGMRQSVTSEVRPGAYRITTRVGPDLGRLSGSVDYPMIVHQGRGPIVPRRARVLRFKPKGSSAFVFRPRVGPAAPKPFATNALKRMTNADFG